jgi:serine/threonine-protein kinase
MTPCSHAKALAALADRYVIDDVLGRGGAGTVYLARDVKHGRAVAIKILNPEAARGIEAKAFLKEIRLTARLQHPHILPLLDSGEAAGFPYYVMPHVKGGSLRDLLDRKKRLSVREALAVARDLADALRYAHENRVVHCDIKPENVLVSAGHAVLADFGVSRAARTETGLWRLSIDNSVGTPAYVSPEQASGDEVIRSQTDQYSLACVVYEMLAGEPPFEGATDVAVVARRFTSPPPNLREAVRHVPSGVAAALRKAMAVDPTRRHKTVWHFFRAVEKSAISRRFVLRELLLLFRLRSWELLRQMVRRLPWRQSHRAARRLIERSKESIETARLGADPTTGAGFQGMG